MPTKKQTELNIALAEQTKEISNNLRNRAALAKKYNDEKKVSMSISPLYRPYFGNVMKVSINGIAIFMPVDNTRHDIPETFADEISARIMAVDAILKKQDTMADFTNNKESTPGELELV